MLEGRHVGARLLFLAGPRATVTALAVRPFDPRPRPGADRDKGEPPGVTQLEGLHGHGDVVSDVVVLEQPRTIVGPPASGGAFGADDGDVLPREVGLLATASMDRTIKLWELPAMVCVSTLEGHGAGVRSLSYDRAQRVLLSAGFEFGVRAWGVSGHQAFPLFALEGGHATSVRSVCAAPGGSRSAVSLDDDGVLAWWDTSRDSASSASDRLTHAVTLSGDDCAVVVPAGFGVDVEMAQHKQREAARARSLELDKLARRRQSLLDAKGGGSPLRPPTSGPRFESESLETEREALDAATASAAIAYSTNAISLACGGKRGVLRLLDANDHRDAEAPPTLVAYSPLTHEIVTAHGGAIKCWDVQMGLLKKEHSLGDGPRAADVSGLSFDARGRRLLVADRAGAVGIRRVRDAAPLMSLGQHRAEVAGLVYAPQDRVVVTVGWDRCLHVYDELEENPDDALLRAVANAHAADITGVALSRDTGLIATCDATGGMKLWDFLDLGLVAEVRDGNGKLLPQATAMAFLEPYPLLVVCDGASGVHVVPTLKNTAPKDAKTQERRVALRFENGKSAFVDGGFRKGAAARCVATRAAQESEIPSFKGSFLGRVPLVSADFWTSDHLSERSRSVNAFTGTRARETLTLKRR